MTILFLRASASSLALAAGLLATRALSAACEASALLAETYFVAAIAASFLSGASLFFAAVVFAWEDYPSTRRRDPASPDEKGS